MKKSLLFMAVLLVLAAGFSGAASGRILRSADEASVSEKVLYGDRAAADGISLTFHTNWDRHLFRDTEYRFEGDGKSTVKTEHTYYQTPHYESSEDPEALDINYLSGYSISGNLGDLSDLKSDPEVYALEAVQDVAGRTGNGGSHTETVLMKDYYQWYPAQVFGNGERLTGLTEEETQELAKYFRVPVPDDLKLEIRVVKDETGEVTELEVENLSNVHVYMTCVCTEKGIFAVLMEELPEELPKETGADGNQEKNNQETAGREKSDQAEPFAGPGVYYIPFAENAPASAENKGEIGNVLNIQGITCCYESEQNDLYLINPHLSEDGSDFLVYGRSKKDGSVIMLVMDTETIRIRQQLVLSEPSDMKKEIYEAGTFPDYQVVFLEYSEDIDFMVLAEDADGQYEKQMEGSLLKNIGEQNQTEEEKEKTEVRMSFITSPRTAVDYDGKHIVFAAELWEDSYPVLVAVYDRSGLLYAGEYYLSVVSKDIYSKLNWEPSPMDSDEPVTVKLPDGE